VPLALIETLPVAIRFFTIKRVVLIVPPIVRFLQMAPVVVRGRLGPVKLPSPTTASVAEVGTPLVQLAANDQLSLAPPIQLVNCADTVVEIAKKERIVIRCFIGRASRNGMDCVSFFYKNYLRNN
jgi:hypothetical protein